MATRFYITPYDPIHWKDVNSPGVQSTLAVRFYNFSQAAKAKWSSYRDYSPFAWSISFGDGNEIGGEFFGHNNQILTLEPLGIHFNQFVVWYRTYISSEYSLFLFAEGSWDSLELTDEITVEEVGQFTGHQ